VARRKSTQIRQDLKKLVPDKRLEVWARETGAVERERKVCIRDLFWTLVLGFGVAKERSVASLRRVFEKTAGVTLAPSAFYDRFTAGLVKLMKVVMGEVIEKASGPSRELRGTLAAFKDVLATDSTIVRLHKLLKAKWPACRTNHTLAALKAHVILSVVGRGAASVKVTSERVHDGPVLKAGKWVRDRLLLFDLGYYRFQLFARIDECKGFFLTRLKDGANPRITGVFRQWRGQAVELVGEKLQDVLSKLQRQILDVEVELTFDRRSYLGKRRRDKMRCRVVGILNEETGRYHLYVTNVPVDTLAAEEVARVYAARWIIELAFRELKSGYELESMPSANEYVVETLLYASFITMMVSRTLLQAVRARHQALAERFPAERWAAIFRSVASDVLCVILYPRRLADAIAKRVMRMVEQEALDPNACRTLLLARSEG
jgi:IS4 transposase